MKIYQLHEYSGSYEDFCDMIIGSYLRKERAEEEKLKAETKEKELVNRSNKCQNCPLIDDFEDGFVDVNVLISENPNYCNEAKLENGDYGIGCENFYTHWDEATFKIIEVEVEE